MQKLIDQTYNPPGSHSKYFRAKSTEITKVGSISNSRLANYPVWSTMFGVKKTLTVVLRFNSGVD